MDTNSVFVGFILFAMWLGWQSGKNDNQDSDDVSMKRRIRDRSNGRGGDPVIINNLKDELMSRGVKPIISGDPSVQHALLEYQLSLVPSDKLVYMTQNAYVPKESGLGRTAGQKILVRQHFSELQGTMWPIRANNQYD